MKKLIKIISVFLTCIMALGMIPAAAYSQGGYQNGDVDRSGAVNIKDATLIQKHLVLLASLDGEQMSLSDVDCNGDVNIMDVTKIQKITAGLEQPEEPQTTQTAPLSESETAGIAPSSLPTSATDASEATQSSGATEATETTVVPTAPNPEVSSSVTVYFTNNRSWSGVYFYLYNSSTGNEAQKWPGAPVTNYTVNNFGEKIYSAQVDTSAYDRIIFNNGAGEQTVNVPVNKASSGFFISDNSKSSPFLVGTYAATGGDSGSIDRVTLKYPTGYNKQIRIWTPADYSPDSQYKYRTIYVMDGQNLFDGENEDYYGGWEVTDAVESMMANGGRGVIIVGIDNKNNRDSELTPNIGQIAPGVPDRELFVNGTGEQFSDFVVNTVMPYVQANYNSSAAPTDNCIAGSSSGGIEAFYIGLEHKDKFGMIGALSPAFLLYDDSVWRTYLGKYDFTAQDMPRLYIYNGNGDFDNELYPDTVAMYDRLVELGYSQDKLKLSIEENAAHNEAYWRVIFPEMLSWCLNI